MSPPGQACGGPTVCGPGQQKVTEGGKQRCRAVAPNIPKVPDAIKVQQLF